MATWEGRTSIATMLLAGRPCARRARRHRASGASVCGGARLLVLADTFARTSAAPAELPIGIVTALVGAPLFLFLLLSRRSRLVA
jgi:ABC-type Fe3+-siderophore transport system permease subunit